MNTGEDIGAAAGAMSIFAGIAAWHPKIRAYRARARQRRADLDGTPPRIEDGRVVDPGRPSLAAAVHDLTATVARIDERTEQLTRNAGSTVADAIHRIEEGVRSAAERAREAAALAATADQQVRALSANLDVWVNVAASDIAQIWETLGETGLDRRRGGDGT